MKLYFETLNESSNKAKEFSSIIDLLYDNNIYLGEVEEILSKYDADYTDEAFDMATKDEQELLMKLAKEEKNKYQRDFDIDELFTLIDRCSQLAGEESWINLQLTAKELMNKAKRLSMI